MEQYVLDGLGRGTMQEDNSLYRSQLTVANTVLSMK
jgi:hypothetical protein